MFAANFESGIVHYIDTNYRALSFIQLLLQLELDFISILSDHLNQMHINLMTYSKFSKAKLS